MEVSYGIGVANRYALFYDENEDPLDAIRSAAHDKEAAQNLKKSAADSASKGADKVKQQTEPKGKIAVPAAAAAAPAAAPAAAAKKGPKEVQVAAKPAEQIRTREGEIACRLVTWYTALPHADLAFLLR